MIRTGVKIVVKNSNKKTRGQILSFLRRRLSSPDEMVILREWNLKPYDSYMTYLSVENLSKQFGGDPRFEVLTFRIGREDKTALVAENGSAKSTLLKIWTGNDTPETGELMSQTG